MYVAPIDGIIDLGIAPFVQRVLNEATHTVESVLEQLGLAGVQVRRASPNWVENLVRFLTPPVVSSLLITIGMLGIILELRTPGLGLPGALSITSLALFFWGHWLVRLAGWEDLLLVGAGLVLLIVEIFVIPGFGVAGALGIVALLAGVSLSLIGGGATWEFVLNVVGRVIFSLLLALVASLALLHFLPRLPFGRRLILQMALPAGAKGGSAPESDRGWLCLSCCHCLTSRGNGSRGALSATPPSRSPWSGFAGRRKQSRRLYQHLVRPATKSMDRRRRLFPRRVPGAILLRDCFWRPAGMCGAGLSLWQSWDLVGLSTLRASSGPVTVY
ncbi:MAG: hypothetical protein K8F29_07390 [Kofleriaceae bacterium]|nr:hypothetical protein [Candidatus Methylomirabilis lanthanidiphila]